MKYFSWLWNNSRGIRWNTVVRIARPSVKHAHAFALKTFTTRQNSPKFDTLILVSGHSIRCKKDNSHSLS